MSMPQFEESDIRCLAVELPDLIKYYHYSGEFQKEIEAIDEALQQPMPDALRKRLILERVIAKGMDEDYDVSFDELLSRIKERYPLATADTLNTIVKMGHADFILQNNAYRFHCDAFANIRKTCTRYLESLENDGIIKTPPPEIDEDQHKNAEIMREKGLRAFRYTVKFSFRPKPEFVREGELLTIHLPYPAVCPEQPEAYRIKSSHPTMISNSDHRTVSIRTPAKKDEDYWVTYRFVNIARYNELDPEKVSAEQPTFFTEQKLPQIRFTPYLRALAEELRGDEKNPLLIAKAIYNYITENIHYSYMREYLYIPNIPEFAALNHRGDCGVQALLFITLCRILGIPARWQSGCTARPTGIGSHDWAQVYIAPYGWLPVDPSFGGGAFRRGDLLMRDHYFGNLDPFRLVTCNDVQAAFYPPKHYLRRDPYDNQRGEGEYRDAGIGFGEWIGSREMISAEEVTDEYL